MNKQYTILTTADEFFWQHFLYVYLPVPFVKLNYVWLTNRELSTNIYENATKIHPSNIQNATVNAVICYNS